MSRPETRAAAERAIPTDDLLHRVQEIASRAPDRMPERVLPLAAETDLVTLTLDELHDLVYASASITLKDAPMSVDDARKWSLRCAQRADVIAREHDGLHRGADPRG